jgi:hypothetical protein
MAAPTAELRFLESIVEMSMPTKVAGEVVLGAPARRIKAPVTVLQQKWVHADGTEEWRDVPTIKEHP